MQAFATGRAWTVAGLATELGYTRQVVYRILRSFASHGWVRRTAGGEYSMGLAVLQLSAGVLPVVRSVAGPILRSLAESQGATAHVTVAEGRLARALVVVEPTWTDWHVAYRVGSTHPLSVGAAGKAIVSGRHGEMGPVMSTGELQASATGVAAPVFVAGLEASLGVVALGELDQRKAAAAVLRAATAMVSELSQ